MYCFERVFRLAGFEAKQCLPFVLIDHFQAGSIVEILLIEPNRAVFFQVDKFFQDNVFITLNVRRSWVTIRRKTHQLIFP
ncbi:hypothetical protein D3C87_1983310 [compost metagenome]